MSVLPIQCSEHRTAPNVRGNGHLIYLFVGSEAGGKAAAIAYTLIETAKLNDIEPQAWLTDVLQRLTDGHPINQIDKLLPWNWHASAN